ncbi:MAG TPA: NADH-ubiquinone oxidoreductase-F iron-sulfur binding region domain-containing protein [Candidatus Acidoferrales bacterium]|nr:NADH-ubiquinone oxidoreductase-F iron-sulfur binding region domain-containing protein [Candidatus Acidoferrales bacterium]
MAAPQKFLLPDRTIDTLDAYLAGGGGEGLQKALAMPRQQVLTELKRAGLRGRGGAGFPTAVKWNTVASSPCPTKYFVCNAAEGEPGTFKDRTLIGRNPYQLIEGIQIGAYAIDARKCYIGMKASFENAYLRLRDALAQMAARKMIHVPVELVRGPEDYLLGEERALLEVIEGKEAMPREADNPPYILGLFTRMLYDVYEPNPAVVDNAETVCNVPHILRNGPDWYRSMGTADTPGTMVFTISGDVRTPGVYELPMGTTLRELIDVWGGGPRPGRRVKAVFSGVTNPVITADHLDVALDFGSMRRIGSGLGSGGYIVYDDAACMVRVAYRYAEFLWLESCGQCTSCKDGGHTATLHLKKLVDGRGSGVDVAAAVQAAVKAPSGTRCFLPSELAAIVPSVVDNYGDEFVAHFGRGCRDCADLMVPKMAAYDEATKTFSYTHGRTTP